MAHPLTDANSRATPEDNPRRPALRLVRTQELSREQWLQVRQQGIGSSDAAAAVGLNPYKSALELWLEKTGRQHLLPSSRQMQDAHTAPTVGEVSPLYWGQLLEPLVAAAYTRTTGRRVRRVNAVLQHPQHPWMLANLDREVIGAPQVQILECKTAGFHGAMLWKEGVPEYIQLQVMHQLAVTGKQSADVAVLIAGQELQIHRIERDETVVAQLIALERCFWGYVERDEQPPADGSDSADLALRSLFPQDRDSTLDLRGDLAMQAVFADLQDVRARISTYGAQEAQLKQAIQQRMADASRAIFDQGEVRWKRSKESQSVDLQALAQEHPELIARYTSTKPGNRRFLVQAHP